MTNWRCRWRWQIFDITLPFIFSSFSALQHRLNSSSLRPSSISRPLLFLLLYWYRCILFLFFLSFECTIDGSMPISMTSRRFRWQICNLTLPILFSSLSALARLFASSSLHCSSASFLFHVMRFLLFDLPSPCDCFSLSSCQIAKQI